MSTESVLRDWRYGQAQAERLVAGLLYIEGFKRIDPQHPLGGPDGKKDVLFETSGNRWISAAYFPPTDVTFAQIKAKFEHDLGGIATNHADGIAFFVNQHLTSGERTSLIAIANPRGFEIFHLVRMRAMLDSPKGCGLRLEYLRLPMTEEEQWSFWQDVNSRVMDTLVESDRHLRELHTKMDILLMRTQSLDFGSMEATSSPVQPTAGTIGQAGSLTIDMLLWIQRLVTEGSKIPERLRGSLRAIQVWISGAGMAIGDARYVPPPAHEIPRRLEILLSEWRSKYPALVGAERGKVLFELATFHHAFLSLHPFADANGRVGRAVIDQAAHELLGMRIGPEWVSRRKSITAHSRKPMEESYNPL